MYGTGRLLFPHKKFCHLGVWERIVIWFQIVLSDHLRTWHWCAENQILQILALEGKLPISGNEKWAIDWTFTTSYHISSLIYLAQNCPSLVNRGSPGSQADRGKNLSQQISWFLYGRVQGLNWRPLTCKACLSHSPSLKSDIRSCQLITLTRFKFKSLQCSMAQ